MKNLIKHLFYFLCVVSEKIISSFRGHILMYHSFTLPDVFFNVSLPDFKKQINYLIKNKYKIVSLADFLDKKEKGLSLRKQIVLSFDDGYLDFVEAIHYLSEEKIPATLFWSTDLPEDTILLSNGKKYSIFSRQQLDELIKKYPLISLGSHGVTHREFTNISEHDLFFELRQSFCDISTMQNKISVIAYPRGKYNRNVVAAVKDCGYLAGCTTYEGGIKINTSNFELPRLSINRSVDMLAFRAKLTALYDLYSKIRR